MKPATLHWYRTASHASPTGFELRAEHRGRTWRMYRLADTTWRVRPTDRPQKEATFRTPEEARRWAAQQAVMNPRNERYARNPQRGSDRKATFKRGQRVALKRPIQPAAKGSVFTVAEVDTKRWKIPRYRLPVGWVSQKDLMPAPKKNPDKGPQQREAERKILRELADRAERSKDDWGTVTEIDGYLNDRRDDDPEAFLIGVRQKVEWNRRQYAETEDDEVSARRAKANINTAITALHALDRDRGLAAEYIQRRGNMMNNPPRKHQAKKARSKTKYRARAWWRSSDNIVWEGPWRDSRRDAVSDAQADYSHVASRVYEIETSDGHVTELSNAQIEQAAAAEYRHLRDRSVWGNPRETEVDETAARELELYIDNDEPLYRQWQAIVRNMWKHTKRGRYDSKRAADGFMHLVDAGAKKYVKEFEGTGKWHVIFDMPTRRYVAEEYAKSFENNSRDENYYKPEGMQANPDSDVFRDFATPAGTEVLWIGAAESYVLVSDQGALLSREILLAAATPDELDAALREYNPRKKNPSRRKNGAGLGALIGSTIGAVLGFGVNSVPLAALGSLVGGTVGGYIGAPKDRKKRGAAGGAIGGAVLGPIGAGVGGYVGGRKPDKDYRRNPEKNPPLARLEQYSKRELERMPSISSGHTDDLKVEEKVAGVPTRWWLSRMTVEDGETHAVHVEQLIDGRWQVVHDYDRPDRYADKYDENPESCGCSHRSSSMSRRIANP